jgi:hypothetical protein
VRTIIGLLCVVVLAGCVSSKTAQIENSKAAALRGKSVAITDRPRAGLVAMTRGYGMLGVVGVGVMVAHGENIIKDNNIQDPAPQINHALVLAAQSQYGIVPVNTPPIHVDTTDVVQLAQAAGGGVDVLFDVQETGRQFRYRPFGSGYIVDSAFKFRVIDVHSRTMIAEGFCLQSTKDDPARPSDDDLLANDAAMLKQTLDAQRDQCRSQFEAQVLNISGSKAAKN